MFRNNRFWKWTLWLLSIAAVIYDKPAAAKDPSLEGEGGQFVFARVQFHSPFSRGWTPGWAHDYPRAERNFLNILAEVTGIATSPDSYVVVQLDSPELMQYPFLYFSEPGTWEITEEEAANFREYLDRGGFAVFDDFDGPRDWYQFYANIRQVVPERPPRKLTVDHPIFQCFYQLESLDMIPPYNIRAIPEFYGVHDESGRLQMMINFNNDIGDFWEWSDESFYPIGLSNEAYKLGVNYVVYAMTH